LRGQRIAAAVERSSGRAVERSSGRAVERSRKCAGMDRDGSVSSSVEVAEREGFEPSKGF
jgi:hypothetical protein